MSSFGDPNSRRAYCAQCEREQRVETLFEKINQWNDEDSGVSGIHEYYAFECRGCETVFFCRSSSNSEDCYDYYDENGIHQTEYPFTKEYFPQTPRAYYTVDVDPKLLEIAPKVDSLVSEAISAANARLNTLAAVGARTAFDSATEYLDIDPELTFKEKLDSLLASGRISNQDMATLEVLIDAGSAAAHRGWKPSDLELQTIFQIVLNFIEVNLVRPETVSALKSKIPERNRRRARRSAPANE